MTASCAAPFTSKLSHVAASKYFLFYKTSERFSSSPFSHPHYPTRTLHSCGDDTNVKDSSLELPNYGIQSQCSIPRWHQVRRLSSDNYGDDDVRVLPVYIEGQGLSYLTRPLSARTH